MCFIIVSSVLHNFRCMFIKDQQRDRKIQSFISAGKVLTLTQLCTAAQTKITGC